MIRLALTCSGLALGLVACSDPPAPPETPRDATSTESPQPSLPAPPQGSLTDTPAPGEELAPSQTTPGPIPTAFRHVWAIDIADCNRDPALTRIAIAPGAIRFYEGRAVVVKAEPEGSDKVLLDVEHMAEGQTSTERHSLALDRTKTRLIYQRRGSSFTYLRCD